METTWNVLWAMVQCQFLEQYNKHKKNDQK